jgi:transcriptional regulator PpsR
MTQGPAESVDLGALSSLAPELAATFVSVASDVALVIDPSGVIRNVALGAEPITAAPHEWVGRPWAETVTGDTRQKIEALLAEARSGGVTRRREVNHPGSDGSDIPVAYAAVRLGRDGPVLAVGRDLRAVSAIQQRFIDAQQAMERDYWQQRQAESRYRMLFQVAHDGVMVVDAQTLQVVDANGAAAQLFHSGIDGLVGRPASAGILPALRPLVDELLTSARTTGRPGEVRALTTASAPGMPGQALDISATPFRADDALLLLVRVRAADRTDETQALGQRLFDFVERTPDAVVITDSSGRVLSANPAFAQLCHDAGSPVGGADGSVGRTLFELLGEQHGGLSGVLDEARRRGIAEQRAAVVGRDAAQPVDLEISAALLAEGDQECVGLTLRRTDQRLTSVPPQVGALAMALDRLAAQMGIVAMPELLQEATELAERHLLDTALARAQGDALQAAQLLGISAENFWLRMRHHGLDKIPASGSPGPGLLN